MKSKQRHISNVSRYISSPHPYIFSAFFQLILRINFAKCTL